MELKEFNQKMHDLDMQRRLKSIMTLKLLALTFSKPLLQLNHFPDWSNCSHADFELETEWPDTERDLMPIFNNLAGNLVHKSREPTDICIVREKGLFCVCVKY